VKVMREVTKTVSWLEVIQFSLSHPSGNTSVKVKTLVWLERVA
jgi:hypothetical protein